MAASALTKRQNIALLEEHEDTAVEVVTHPGGSGSLRNSVETASRLLREGKSVRLTAKAQHANRCVTVAEIIRGTVPSVTQKTAIRGLQEVGCARRDLLQIEILQIPWPETNTPVPDGFQPLFSPEEFERARQTREKKADSMRAQEGSHDEGTDQMLD
uniref:Uncharacterized protein n=1 Tax=Chromera velia CCMP2878 TaxID=1169474 RepID=A0A0G4HFB4_9ALVE|mmetsp:Transcript_51778/g.101476  ORF Transcript_51778/g.101476 Transcript_51778/m.101476 type:complete len:158 (-) Transcript_51778:163-636(-)|eukprot:Cvel_6614.t1-p1 / transcript=Cvel_6614.t1 / gene=Cvel_6614 / organism=Chromera_velia_CCMP2878 / gene_product=hypothetical protein / transcript_product=hypothetical protein / location=Cvel_scaffold327:61982-64783(-) / protein_length=157 / sequence_SO=supercontig / SO=protein_coding / is_pseudo=false